MSLLRIIESCAEGLLRIVIGAGLVWIGAVEGAGYGAFLEVVGGIFVGAGITEIWLAETAVRRLPRRRSMNDIHPALITCDVPVFYATTDGQTRQIALRLAALLHDRGLSSRAIDVASTDAQYVDWPHVQAALLGASLHAHRHQRSAERFARDHAADLNGHPSAFFSVSLATASDLAEERRAASQLASDLPARAAWHPDVIVCIAGRLAYTTYGWITRIVMKRIARRRGAPTDTSRDYELTNWDEVARLADTVGRAIGATASHKVA